MGPQKWITSRESIAVASSLWWSARFLHFFNKMFSLTLAIILFTPFVLSESINGPVLDGPSPRSLKSSKNAKIDITWHDNGYVSMNAVQNNGFSTQIRLYSFRPSSTRPSSPSITECGIHTLCISNDGINHTQITIDPSKEYITISRTFPAMNDQVKMADCFQLKSDVQWMGGPEHRHQVWPIQHSYFEEEPYVPTDHTNMAITERYWLTSRGMYIHASPSSPMFLDQNNFLDKYLCLTTEHKAPYSQKGELNAYYEIGWLNNSRLAHEFVVDRHFSKPSGHPDERIIKNPIWSTWARFKGNINQEIVNDFASDIIDHGFNANQLEIDDNWETCYGSAVFDTKKFPNVTQGVKGLNTKGFRVTLWIHPFINQGCEPAYSTALRNNYFVKNEKGEVTASWWRGANSAVIDFTNTNATSWWIGRLKELQKLGIGGFKFDAGEISWLPQPPILSGSAQSNPAIYVKSYVTAVAKNFGNVIEVRTGWDSQDLPVFVRMLDKDSRYTWNNGLPTLITTLLQMNLAGYVYALPDMIGGDGNSLESIDGTVYPSKDLFIRWLQATVFMPALQFSFVPWDYDNETIRISKKYINLHADMTPTILRLMNNSISTGAPLNPPIWWVDPSNEEAHKINDEFLLGEEILVAPVITENSMRRDIYLPKGVWKNGNDPRVEYIGPLWLRDFHVPLDVLPYFVKAK